MGVRRIVAAVLFVAVVWCLSHAFGRGAPRAVHKSYETPPDDDLVVVRKRFVSRANSKLGPLGRVSFAGGPRARPDQRLGGARVRRPGVVSLNEDDTGAGGPDNGAGLSSGLSADGDVTRAQAAYTKNSTTPPRRRRYGRSRRATRRHPHNAPFSLVDSHAGDGRAPTSHLRGHANIILQQLGKKGLDPKFVHAVQTQHVKQEHFYQLPAGSSPIHTYDVLDGTDANTQNDQEDADENADENGDADANADAMSQTSDHAAIPLDFAAWHGSVGVKGSHIPWTNEDLNDAAIAQLPQVSEFLDILFDEEITFLRGLWQASYGNAHRTQAVFGTASLEHIMEFVWWLARIGDVRGKRAWDLMCAIIHAIEETNLTTMGRSSILSNVLMEVLVANARGKLGISQTDSEKLERTICRLLQVAQCRYAAVGADALARGERPDLAAFWRAMYADSRRGVANALRPMYQEDNQKTKQKFVILANPASRDVDGEETPVLAACAFEATFPELRMCKGTARIASSDVHKCFEALKFMHEGVDGTPIDDIENFMLALGLEHNKILTVFGLHKPVPLPPTPQPPTPQPPTVSPRPSPAPTPAPTYVSYGTNFGTRVLIIVVPPDSEYFATLLLFRVGPYKLVKLFCPEHENPDVVREAIFHLYNSGVPMGDTSLADLLLDLRCGPGNWVPGPTFEAVPELRA